MEKKECKRCGWQWIPRIETITMCPRCKSKLWDSLKNAKRTLSKFKREKSFNIRLSNFEYDKIKDNIEKYGFNSMSDYLRYVGMNSIITGSSTCEDIRSGTTK